MADVARLAKVVRDARAAFVAAERDRRVITLLSTAILPALLAVWVGLVDVIWARSAWLFVAVLIVLVGLQVVLAWRALDQPQTLHQALVEIEALERKKETLTKQRDGLATESSRLDRLQAWLLACHAIEDRLHAVQTSPPKEFNWTDLFDVLLAPICDVRTRSLPISEGDLWSIVVFVHDPTSNLLRPVWWRRDQSHPRHRRPTRSWRPNEGHVGSAFALGKAIYSSDAGVAEAQQWMNVPPYKQLVDDAKTYRSFASVPFGAGGPQFNDGQRPRGVIAATCAVPGVFGEERNVLAVRHVAEILTSLDPLLEALVARGTWPLGHSDLFSDA